VSNQLGFARSKANLRVIDPPAYANFSLAAAVGPQERIVSSPANAMVFSEMCYFCQTSTNGTRSTVQRFVFDAGTGHWTRSEHAYTQLFDIALSPDESTLLVLTASQLLLVDPQTMTTTKTIALPGTPSGLARQLAVMNNGLAIIQSLDKAYSLRTDAFVTISGLTVGGPFSSDPPGGIQASRDGSRAIFGAPVNQFAVPYRYYDATTGTVVFSPTSGFYARGSYSRHATEAFVSNLLLNVDLSSLGTLALTSDTGEISPDGNRIYAVDLSVDPYQLRVFDVSRAITELTPISITGVNTGIARAAVDPRGNAVFVVAENGFFVFDVH
jgi:hypothetical protein